MGWTYLHDWVVMRAVWSWERSAVLPYSSYFHPCPPAPAPPALQAAHPKKERARKITKRSAPYTEVSKVLTFHGFTFKCFTQLTKYWIQK